MSNKKNAAAWKNKQKIVAGSGFEQFLFYFWQFTWGLPVNLVGFIVWVICKLRHRPTERFCNSFITYIQKKNFGGLSLGLFIFIDGKTNNQDWLYDTRIHEYGHTIQCLLLGALYYPVIAIPSAIWCNFFNGWRKKNNVDYYWLYCESWANAWGQKWSGLSQRYKLRKAK